MRGIFVVQPSWISAIVASQHPCAHDVPIGRSESYPMKKNLPPLRIRHEPPSLEEAVEAAAGITDDLQLQAEFAAELMGLGVDDVLPAVKAAARAAAAPKRTLSIAAPHGSHQPERKVIVEHRTSRRIAPGAPVGRPMVRLTPR
jgi:hypothetical protein